MVITPPTQSAGLKTRNVIWFRAATTKPINRQNKTKAFVDKNSHLSFVMTNLENMENCGKSWKIIQFSTILYIKLRILYNYIIGNINMIHSRFLCLDQALLDSRLLGQVQLNKNHTENVLSIKFETWHNLGSFMLLSRHSLTFKRKTSFIQ